MSSERIFVGRVKFNVIGRVGRIKVVGYGGKTKVKGKGE